MSDHSWMDVPPAEERRRKAISATRLLADVAPPGASELAKAALTVCSMLEASVRDCEAFRCQLDNATANWREQKEQADRLAARVLELEGRL